MNISIKFIAEKLDAHPAIKQWSWFVLLWLGGLAAALSLAYPIKLLIKLAG